MTETTVEEAKAALADAEQARRAASKARDDAVQAVRGVHDPLVAAADGKIREAKRALAEAESRAAADHEWEGRRVVKVTEIRDRWTQRVIGEERAEGVVFTYRSGVDLGPGHSYPPQIGTPMVRLLKKDGTPGKKTARMRDAWGGDWTLAEPVQ